MNLEIPINAGETEVQEVRCDNKINFPASNDGNSPFAGNYDNYSSVVNPMRLGGCFESDFGTDISKKLI